MKKIKTVIVFFLAISCFSFSMNANTKMNENKELSPGERSIISISALTARGDLSNLKIALNTGLGAGLTVNKIKEVLVHLYAYCGFPRSIRGLQTFMEALDERKAKGFTDETGRDASPIIEETNKYQRGKKILSELTKSPQERPISGYGAFAPVIDTFLKEHLFADIFERDVLTYAERELVTISVLSAMSGVEPMLRSHLTISLNTGLTPGQLTEFVGIIQSTVGKKEAKVAQAVLNEVLKSRQILQSEPLFARGNQITSKNFSGTAWLNMMGATDTTLHVSYGNVTFAPKARTNWHSHPGGQLLFITEGKGFYQAKGEPARLLKKGDFMEIPRKVVHWHGAAPDSEFAHIAVSLNTDDGGAVWVEPVTDEEFEQSAK